MYKILQSYLRRLTNLSGNNRSLLFLRLISDQTLDVHAFDFQNGQPSFSIIEGLIARKKKIELCKTADSRDEDTNNLSKRLKKLVRIDKFIFEERGSKDLYVGWPFLRGKFADGTLVRAPLMFFPVALVSDDKHWYLELRPNVNITLNKSFLLAYSYFNQTNVDEELIERVFDDYDTDSTVFRTELYQIFKDSPVEINFNQDNFTDKLTPFRNFKKSEFDEDQKNGELKLYPEAALGIFPQAGSHLVPDYLALLERKNIQDLEEFFISKSIAEESDKEDFRKDNFTYLHKVKEEQTFTPFKMDAYQENALKAIKKGNSLVVQGPPGTGKSQLICNLIADFIARGRNVLLVSQKRAALDIVYQRLEEQDINDFAALVHDFKNDRKSLYEKISTQIDRLDEYKYKNNSLDAIQLERKFTQLSRRIDQISEELEEFKSILFDESECGISVKQLYLTSDLNAPAINVRQEYKNFNFAELDEFLINLRSYADYASSFRQEGYSWIDRKPFTNYGLNELQRMVDILEEIPEFASVISAGVHRAIGQNIDFETAGYILERREQVLEMLHHLGLPESYKYFSHMAPYADSDTDPLSLSNTERVLLDCFNNEGLESNLAQSELGKFQEALQRRMDATKSPIKFLSWLFVSKDKQFLRRILAANGLKPNRQGYRMLVKKIDNRLNFEHNLTKLKERAWIIDIPATYQKGVFQNWFHAVKDALRAKLIFNSVRNFKDYFNPQNLTFEQLKAKLNELFEVIDPIPQKLAEWRTYLSDKQLNSLFNDKVVASELIKILKKDFDSLCEFDNLQANFAPHQWKVIDNIYTESEESLDAPAVEAIFQNSVRLAWIDHIETKYPILRSVSSLKFQKLEAELQHAVRDKLKISREILLLRARERTYQDVQYNRLNNMVTYRDLKHQVTKKRQVWPLRKLLSNFSHEIFDLVPCWLGSPESVSAIFPIEGLFDLVVFDEASQAFSEKGIPAMYRGRQVVIAGDSKQLRPNDLYKVRWEEEEMDSAALEVDSLLELAEQYLMNVQLKGHYRSKTLDLIEFSNQHFYKGRLRLLPDSNIVNRNEPAIVYDKVDGIWENNINDIEARKVVSLVLHLLETSEDKDIGVVTFNAKQQVHILDVLEEEAAERKVAIPNNLFVKNIENVQGDERDIIIFSTGYGPDKNGKVIMQFGSLNVEGGENRLNVAITRAREKIYVVSSIYPQQLRTDEVRNEGPRLLKDYLQYALQVSEGKFKPSLPPSEKHHADWYLKRRIEAWTKEALGDYQFKEELPFADLTIRENGKYLGLVVTDDDLYHQSVSIKEMHVYKPFALSNKNWKFKGVFSREFWNDPEKVKESITRFVSLNSQ